MKGTEGEKGNKWPQKDTERGRSAFYRFYVVHDDISKMCEQNDPYFYAANQTC